MSSVAPTEGLAIDPIALTNDYSDQTVFLGRLKPGCARESRRLVHVFPLARDVLHGTKLTARCGERLPIGDLEWLPALAGLPCDRCMVRCLADS